MTLTYISIMKMLVFLIIIRYAVCCLLAGREIGICSSNPLPADSFCYSDIDPFVCVPAHNKTWSQYNATYKDEQIQSTFLSIVQQQLIDEYINQNATLLLANNPTCYSAYKQFICKWNFPTCDQSNNTSKPMCQSICNAFHTNCGGTTDACSIIYNSIDLGLDENC